MMSLLTDIAKNRRQASVYRILDVGLKKLELAFSFTQFQRTAQRIASIL